MVKIYKQKNFSLYSNFDNGFIIHNTYKPFEKGHTHLNNYHTARYLIKLAYHGIVPSHLSIYLIDSLIRISIDDEYIRRLKILKEKELKLEKQDKKTR